MLNALCASCEAKLGVACRMHKADVCFTRCIATRLHCGESEGSVGFGSSGLSCLSDR